MYCERTVVNHTSRGLLVRSINGSLLELRHEALSYLNGICEWKFVLIVEMSSVYLVQIYQHWCQLSHSHEVNSFSLLHLNNASIKITSFDHHNACYS